MKKLSLLLLAVTFCSSCNFDDARLIRKKITNNDIWVTWYFKSYIENVSPDYIVVEKAENEKRILEADAGEGLSDVRISDDSIIIKFFKRDPKSALPKADVPNIFGYKIIIDTTATYQDFNNVPLGIK